MKRKYLIFTIVFGLTLLNVPEVEGQTGIIPYYIEIDDTIFYPNETIQINGSWELYYSGTVECYTQFRIYNNSEFEEIYLVWKSQKYNDTCKVFKSESIQILSILDINTSFIGSIDLYLTLSYYCWDPPDIIDVNFFNQTFKIIGKAYSHLEKMDINQNLFYPNETLTITTSWILDYNEPEICYTQVRIYNELSFNKNSLMWESNKFNATGYIQKFFKIPLQNLISFPINNSIDIYLTFYYYYEDINNIHKSVHLLNTTIQLRPYPISDYQSSDPHNYLSIIIPSGIGSIFLFIIIGLFLSKRDKTKKIEQITIDF